MELIFCFFAGQFYKAIRGDKMETGQKFNKRAFVSAGMAISVIGLPFSGLMNHFLGLEAFSTSRHVWMSVHNILAFFFTIFSIWHIKLNWKPLANHFKDMSRVFIRREAIYAASLIFFFLALFVFHALHMPQMR